MDLRTALAILNLDAEATLAQAKKAYRTLAKQYHPDVTGPGNAGESDPEARMKEINQAFRYLGPFLKVNAPEKKASVETPVARPPEEKPETRKIWGEIFNHCRRFLARCLVQEEPPRDMPKNPSPSKPGLKRTTKNFRTVLKNIHTGPSEKGKAPSLGPKNKKSSPKPSFGYQQKYMEMKRKMKSGRSWKNTEASVSPITGIDPVTRVNAAGED